jgi:hypothetical protein
MTSIAKRADTDPERRPVRGASDEPIIMADDQAASLRPWCEKRGEPEPEDLSKNLLVQPPRHERTRGAVEVVRGKFIAALMRGSQRAMPLNACSVDLEDHADHLMEVLGAVSGYVAAILDEVAENVPGGLDRRSIDALLCDLFSEVTGTLRNAADALPLPGRRS